MRSVPSTDGVSVAVHHLAGPDEPGAPTWLLAHATGFCGPVWRPFAAALAALAPGTRVVAPDMRWHGLTGAPPGPLEVTWTGHVPDLLAVIDALAAEGTTDVRGIGHSMGGAALLLTAAARPGALGSLWLYEPVVPPAEHLGGMRTGGNPLADGAERRRPSFPSAQAALDNFASKPPMASFHPDALAGYVDGGFEALDDGTVTLRCPPAQEAAVYRAAATREAWDAAAATTCPTTVAGGRPDPGPPAWAALVADHVPDGRHAPHPDLGHFGPLEVPGRLAADAVEAHRRP